ncbi:MAG: esterase-like activity of phytase family protein [Paraprevotella sp.]|nr:esterase-like activity of phytase family protein [Paraprevotella sp.]
MNRVLNVWLSLCCCCTAVSAGAQQAKQLRQQRLSRWGIPAADYSGIASLGQGRYALISDKQDGYYPFSLYLSSRDGRVLQAGRGTLLAGSHGAVGRDCEGIAYDPRARSLYISGENDQRILEYDLQGQPTGREMQVPEMMRREAVYGNLGFEALACDTCGHRFWAMTESCLKADGHPAGPGHRVKNLLRLQAFDEGGRADKQYAYEMELPQARKAGRHYVFGVSALSALPDGRLLVMEREVYIASRYMGSWARVDIFVVDPKQAPSLPPETTAEEARKYVLRKRKLTSFRTRLTPVSNRLANYEGMCTGPRLDDGRLTVLLVSDSQGGVGKGSIRLQDYLKVLVLPPEYSF